MNQSVKNLKLNYKRTCLIGFAFFGILLLWQVYDTWCPLLLTNALTAKYPGKSDLDVQWVVGIIMALDNIAALALLPIFGRLSDKTKTPIGKRMPYILIGTIVVAMVFPFIPLFFTKDNLVGMIACMGVVLVAMMMYRNPAVALMPDITPKPLRAKANGIINIMGYFGGAFAAVLGIVWSLSDYLDDRTNGNPLIAILPFIFASILMIISAIVLFFTIKENKLAEELKEDMELGEQMAAIEDKVEDDKPLTKANKKMLYAILAAEFLWFMAENAVSTFLSNYVYYYLWGPFKLGIILTVVGGVGSVVGFAIAGGIAEKIGRKWTITLGLTITLVGYLLFCFVRQTVDPSAGETARLTSIPALLYAVYLIKGFGMSLVHNCSFPMVVELATQKTIGKFTGHYYTASMAAQTLTPILLGFILMKTAKWEVLPFYATVLIAGSLVVFGLLVKNIKATKVANVKGLEALGQDD